MKAIVLLVVVTLLLGSCFYMPENVRPTVEAIETQIEIPSIEPATPTLVPSSTATSTLAPSKTSTVTLTPTSTLVPTPEGVTELGYFLWSLSNDLGFKIEPVPREEVVESPFVCSNWLYSENADGVLYIDTIFSGGYEISQNAKYFLVISCGVDVRNSIVRGLGFSIYKGDIFPECQGGKLPGDVSNVSECIWVVGGGDGSPFYYEGSTKPDEKGITWFTKTVYPLDTEQVELLTKKYFLETFPKQRLISARAL